MTASPPCDCGADDCPRCYPGALDWVRCCKCGYGARRWQTDEGWGDDGPDLICPACLEKIEQDGKLAAAEAAEAADTARCCRCGTELEAWQADEARWEMDTRGRWVCVDCLGDEE